MQEWKGREILYPNDMHFFMQGRDTLNADFICIPHGEKQDKTAASDYKINRYKYLIYS